MFSIVKLFMDYITNRSLSQRSGFHKRFFNMYSSGLDTEKIKTIRIFSTCTSELTCKLST